MSDPFMFGVWGDKPQAPAPIKPVFDGTDPMEVVRSIPAWVPNSPVDAVSRPEWNPRIVIDFAQRADDRQDRRAPTQ